MARRRRRYGFGGWREYVPVAERRRRAARMTVKASADGSPLQPVHIEGRTIATTAWGKAWCAHIEGFRDYSNRLPRGRTYARNGSVIDLRITKGEIRAQVVGSELYEQVITIRPCKPAIWKRVVARCKGSVGSLIELLQGRVSAHTMQEMTADADGILPDLSQVKKSCSCPDWARLCKHLAAVLYGVGARLDEQPQLLFMLRGVDVRDLVTTADALASASGPTRRLEGDLSTVFGIDLDDDPGPPPKRPASRRKSAQSKGRKRGTKPKPGSKPTPKAAPDGTGYQVRYRLKRSGVIETLPGPGLRSGSGKQISRQALLSQGVPASTISSWMLHGLLQPTGTRGVYRHTARSRRRLKDYLR